MQDINNFKFSSVTINRLIPDILFGIDSPIWIVKVAILSDNQKLETETIASHRRLIMVKLTFIKLIHCLSN